MSIATAEPVRRIVCRGRPTPEQVEVLKSCAESFWNFLPYWKFKNRETGEVRAFDHVWQGQAQLIDAMEGHDRLFALKAGKLGFTEIECAYDGWVLRFGQPNARVHLFSLGLQSSRELLAIVRFGIEHLPEWMQLPFLENEAGADTSTEFKLSAGPDDVRHIVSYASGVNIAIDQTATHTHADEFARWRYGDRMWQGVQSTISPYGGTLHIVTRGAGPNWAAKIYREARAGRSKLAAVFANWEARKDRTKEWRDAEALSMTEAGLWQYLPETWQQALQGDASYVYPQFDNPPGRHAVWSDPYPLSKCVKVAVGLDPGGGAPTAMALLGERESGRAHQYAEFYKPGATQDELEAQLLAWQDIAGDNIIQIFGDWESVMLATLQAHGFAAQAADKGRKEGIRLVSQRLNTGGYTVNAETCPRTVEEYTDYRWANVTDATTRVEYAGDRPVAHHADLMDGVRYSVMGLAQWEEPEIITLPSGLRVYAG